MRRPSQWFSILPENDDCTRRWFQRCQEWNGGPGYGPESLWRLIVGDLAAQAEHDFGDYAGARFGIDVHLWEDTGEFDYDDTDRWHDHSVTVVLWRWGVFFAWRGGRKAGR